MSRARGRSSSRKPARRASRASCRSGRIGPYQSGRGKDWLKIKCTRGAEFVIGGYSRSEVRGKPFSSLLLGTFDGGKLVYAGKVGTGFDADDFKNLSRKFKPLERATSAFVEVPAAERKDAVWLEPKLVCQVAYTEWTRDGRLRHPSYQGLREDKPAREVHRDQTEDEEASMAKTSAKASGEPVFDGITLTNPDRVFFPDIGFTKLDLARYYETVAPFMLPYVVRRPISLVRCPEGYESECFFQRHAMKGMSNTIKEIPIAGGESKKKYLYIDGAPGLFGLVQIGVLEIHDWGVSLDHIDAPDRIVFDLDPDEDLDLATLKAAAIEVRDFLADLGLQSFLKSTGGKGLHVVAPLRPKLGWAEVKPFAKAIADALVAARPDRYTANPLKKDARGQDLRRLSPQSARRLRHRQLFDPGQEGGARRLSAPLGRTEGAESRRSLHGEDAAGTAQGAQARSMGRIFLDPPVDYREGAQGARTGLRAVKIP